MRRTILFALTAGLGIAAAVQAAPAESASNGSQPVSTAMENPGKVTLTVGEGGGSQTFAFGKDLVASTLQAKPHVAIKDSDIVFVGYGVDAPEWNWNDYKNLDVKGKTVVVLVNDPGFGDHDASLFKGKAMTYYG